MEGERRLCAPFFDLGAKQMKDISLRILDMECAACVARLDRALEKLPGVQRAAVNYTAASALITYDEGVTDLAAIAARVKRAGFRVPVEEQDLLPAEADAERLPPRRTRCARCSASRTWPCRRTARSQRTSGPSAWTGATLPLPARTRAAPSRSASCAAATRIRSSKSAWTCSKRS